MSESDFQNKLYQLDGGAELGLLSKEDILELMLHKRLSSDTAFIDLKHSEEKLSVDSLLNLEEELPPPVPEVLQSKSRIVGFFSPLCHFEIDDKPHPWRRFLARSVDSSVVVCVFFLYCVLAVISISPLHFYSFGKYLEASLGLELAASLLAELIVISLGAVSALPLAAFIAYLGTTPGKFLFGIYIQQENGRNIGFKKAYKRELKVLFYGLGLFIPFIMLICLIVQYRKYKKNGITSWDKDLNLSIRFRKSGKIQSFLVIIAVTMFLVIDVLVRTFLKSIE